MSFNKYFGLTWSVSYTINSLYNKAVSVVESPVVTGLPTGTIQPFGLLKF